METTIVNYDKMTLKELEREHVNQGQILLDMINDGKYSQKDIESQKSLVDYLFKKIRAKHKTISKSIGY